MMIAMSYVAPPNIWTAKWYIIHNIFFYFIEGRFIVQCLIRFQNCADINIRIGAAPKAF
jgi:hypothetical protein